MNFETFCRASVFLLVLVLNRRIIAEDPELIWGKVENILDSSSWDTKGEFLVRMAFRHTSKEDLTRLSSSTSTSIAIRAYFEQSIRLGTPESAIAFVENCESHLLVKFPPWVKMAIANGRFHESEFIPDLDGISPYRPYPTREIDHNWYAVHTEETNTLKLNSTDERQVLLRNVNFPKADGHLTGGVSNNHMVVAIHGNYPDQFCILCVDTKEQREIWRASCRDGDNIHFYSGPSSMFVSVLMNNTHVVIVAVSSSGMFLDVRGIKDGKLIGQFSSLL
ncbi:hypothetical protein KOR42_11420 [Thalassoglobus neptunius]|uniref:Uncharacterized protein n=1 Tax=Thalassoglobus neptunius TaxID=1938619 RepID=A0A5C5X461_9PLAN|nr:hypothetical protein [Thalassoglobus neptunius]TWT57776.1 hypothetical protein KOR42_11420 [Thalassoglobus neptunius]